MGWVYLDDHFDEHPKVLAARERHKDAPWLFISGLCFCRRSSPTGVILSAQIPRLVTRYQAAARVALIESGLWDETIGGIVIHDYDDWNRPNDVRTASARNAARARWRGNR